MFEVIEEFFFEVSEECEVVLVSVCWGWVVVVLIVFEGFEVVFVNFFDLVMLIVFVVVDFV